MLPSACDATGQDEILAPNPSLVLDVRFEASFHTLFGKNLSSGLAGNGTRLFKKFLNYFDTLDCEEPCGHVVVERWKTNDFDIDILQMISSANGCLEQQPNLQQAPKPLTPVFIVENGEQIGEHIFQNVLASEGWVYS